MCILCATDCPVFRFIFKINMLVPSDIINRSELNDFRAQFCQCMSKYLGVIFYKRVVDSKSKAYILALAIF